MSETNILYKLENSGVEVDGEVGMSLRVACDLIVCVCVWKRGGGEDFQTRQAKKKKVFDLNSPLHLLIY